MWIYVDDTIKKHLEKKNPQVAEEYAFLHQIPFKLFQADWEKYGKAAGPIRNRRNMIQMARKYHLRGIIVEIGKGVMG